MRGGTEVGTANTAKIRESIKEALSAKWNKNILGHIVVHGKSVQGKLSDIIKLQS